MSEKSSPAELLRQCETLQVELQVLCASLRVHEAAAAVPSQERLRELRERETKIIAHVLFMKLEELFTDEGDLVRISCSWHELERVLPLDLERV